MFHLSDLLVGSEYFSSIFSSAYHLYQILIILDNVINYHTNLVNWSLQASLIFSAVAGTLSVKTEL